MEKRLINGHNIKETFVLHSIEEKVIYKKKFLGLEE